LAFDSFKISATAGEVDEGPWAETELERQEKPRTVSGSKALISVVSLNFAVLQREMRRVLSAIMT
jgi:hypothetical protein